MTSTFILLSDEIKIGLLDVRSGNMKLGKMWLFHLQKIDILWKESLNSDGHQFHQYQQDERSSFILAELTVQNTSLTTTYDVGNLGFGLGQEQRCGGV